MPPSDVVAWIEDHYGPKLYDPLCFTAEDAGATIAFNKVGSPDDARIVTSTDGQAWTDYTFNDVITLASAGDKVYFRAKTENQTLGSINSDYYQFVMTGKIAASGNIQTLLKADGSRTDAPAYCYNYMFEGCSQLTTAPELPATTLASGCYADMFLRCSSLASIDASFSAWNPTSATSGWVNGVAASDTFTCPDALLDVRGVNNIPEGWTKADK